MSLFDVIKYPITEDFNLEDLKCIPLKALHAWWYLDIMKISRFRTIAYGYSPNPIDINRMVTYMTVVDAKFLPAMCKMLRERIEEL